MKVLIDWLNPVGVEKGIKAVISANFRVGAELKFITYRRISVSKTLKKSFSTATPDFVN